MTKVTKASKAKIERRKRLSEDLSAFIAIATRLERSITRSIKMGDFEKTVLWPK